MLGTLPGTFFFFFNCHSPSLTQNPLQVGLCHDQVPVKLAAPEVFGLWSPALCSPPPLAAESLALGRKWKHTGPFFSFSSSSSSFFLFFSRQQPSQFSLADSGLKELSGLLIRFQNRKECLSCSRLCQHHLINPLHTLTQAWWAVMDRQPGSALESTWKESPSQLPGCRASGGCIRDK